MEGSIPCLDTSECYQYWWILTNLANRNVINIYHTNVSLPSLTTHLNRKSDPGGYFLLRNLKSAYCQCIYCQCIVTVSVTRYHPCKETELKGRTQGKRCLKRVKIVSTPQVQYRYAAGPVSWMRCAECNPRQQSLQVIQAKWLEVQRKSAQRERVLRKKA